MVQMNLFGKPGIVPEGFRYEPDVLSRFVRALVTEYVPGTPIGWHRDMPPFDRIVGFSFGTSCPFHMRLEVGKKWQRFSQAVEPRSVYVMEGPARYQWQHSIPPLKELRYSVTFRTVR